MTATVPTVTRSWPGTPQPWQLLVTVMRDLRAQPLQSVAGALVVAAVCLVVFTTTGQAAASEQSVLSRIDSTGIRTIVMADGNGTAGLTSDSVDAVSHVSTVESVFGLGDAVDGKSADAPVTGAVALRPFIGALPHDIELVSGREANPGEALIGERAAQQLGLADGVGALQSSQGEWPIVGVYRASGAVDNLNDIALTMSPPTVTDLRYLYVIATDVHAVDSLAAMLPELATLRAPEKATVEPPTAAIELREVISGDLGRSSRALMLAVLGVGLAMIGITTYVSVAGRRTTYGRRRALGATRSAIVVMVLAGTAVSSAIGAVVGTLAGVIAMSQIAPNLPAPSFIAAVPVLAILMGLIGSVAPALIAARRDPLRVLRVP